MAGQSLQETHRAMRDHDRYTMIDIAPQATHDRPYIRTVQIVRELDTTPGLSYLSDPDRYDDCTPEERSEYNRQDRARLRAYDRGEWYMLGIYAQATIAVPMGQNCACLQTIKSPGLWGIESDSDAAHFDETAADQLDELKEILTALHVDLTAWPIAIKTRGE